MIRAEEFPEKRGYAGELKRQEFHKGIVKGNRVRVNVHCSVLGQSHLNGIEKEVQLAILAE